LSSEPVDLYVPVALRDRAYAEATHEAVHVFTDVYLKRKNGKTASLWHWFDEATAAYFEREINRDNPATLNYYHALLWVNQTHLSPELSAGNRDGEPVYNYSPWFLMGLVEFTGDEDFIRKVWHEAGENETPRDVLRRLLKSDGLTLEEILHRYAVWSHRTRRLDELAHKRYGDRKFAYVFRIDPRELKPDSCECKVGPLACHYYRIGPVSGLKRLRVEVEPRESEALPHLRATLHDLHHPVEASPMPVELHRRNGTLLYEGPAAPFGGRRLALVVSCTDLSKHQFRWYRVRVEPNPS
jgi:hypothetical protein